MCGSRSWSDATVIGNVLDDLLGSLPDGERLVLIHGGCPKGADKVAHEEASKRQIQTIVEKAEWNTYGKAAGMIRNLLMITNHSPDVTYAFRSPGKSNGTDDMIKKSRAHKIPTYVIEVGITATLL